MARCPICGAGAEAEPALEPHTAAGPGEHLWCRGETCGARTDSLPTHVEHGVQAWFARREVLTREGRSVTVPLMVRNAGRHTDEYRPVVPEEFTAPDAEVQVAVSAAGRRGRDPAPPLRLAPGETGAWDVTCTVPRRPDPVGTLLGLGDTLGLPGAAAVGRTRETAHLVERHLVRLGAVSVARPETAARGELTVIVAAKPEREDDAPRQADPARSAHPNGQAHPGHPVGRPYPAHPVHPAQPVRRTHPVRRTRPGRRNGGRAVRRVAATVFVVLGIIAAAVAVSEERAARHRADADKRGGSAASQDPWTYDDAADKQGPGTEPGDTGPGQATPTRSRNPGTPSTRNPAPGATQGTQDARRPGAGAPDPNGGKASPPPGQAPVARNPTRSPAAQAGPAGGQVTLVPAPVQVQPQNQEPTFGGTGKAPPPPPAPPPPVRTWQLGVHLAAGSWAGTAITVTVDGVPQATCNGPNANCPYTVKDGSSVTLRARDYVYTWGVPGCTTEINTHAPCSFTMRQDVPVNVNVRTDPG
ncbi:hypothetical protein [Yinghuangia seranimata]|uniref:hypothetical protein n=1 Tax=Yinghuangia seranimata TaxID=408067 RepID=UPI00248C8541|nr:hypothetical protein [Yinghuangia seranimata]MDI2126051.1 hypothetical protein [Yinghuangia seranimata]